MAIVEGFGGRSELAGELREYRVEQHLERLGDLLQRLGFVRPSGTGKDTADPTAVDMKKPRDHRSDDGAELRIHGPG